jgi:hypothetical protein
MLKLLHIPQRSNTRKRMATGHRGRSHPCGDRIAQTHVLHITM